MKRLALVLAVLLATPACAQDFFIGTLKTVKDRGTLLLGVQDDAVPFSFTGPDKQPTGFSVDLCLGIAADMARLIRLEIIPADAETWKTGLRIRLVPTSPDRRITGLSAGTIDLMCGASTLTEDRAKVIAFSSVIFLTGTRLLVTADSGAASYRDLAGKTVAVVGGTTNAAVMTALSRQASPAMTVIEAPTLTAAAVMLRDKRVAAVAADDVLLAGLLATAADAARFRVVGDMLSTGPYALMFRRNDAQLDGVVHTSLRRMAADGTLRGLYDKWFTAKLPGGGSINRPISPDLADLYATLGQAD